MLSALNKKLFKYNFLRFLKRFAVLHNATHTYHSVWLSEVCEHAGTETMLENSACSVESFHEMGPLKGGGGYRHGF